jgi:hypothetical protein
MGKVVNDMPDLEAPAMIPGELGELLGQIEREKVPEKLLELAVRLQDALARQRVKAGALPQVTDRGRQTVGG